MVMSWMQLAAAVREYATERWADNVEALSLVLLHRGEVHLPLPPLRQQEFLFVDGMDLEPSEETARPLRVPGCGSIYWPALGTFRFESVRQRRVLSALWLAMLKGAPEVPEKKLLRLARTKRTRLEHLFHGHRAWGLLIVGGRVQGNYRLPELSSGNGAA